MKTLKPINEYPPETQHFILAIKRLLLMYEECQTLEQLEAFDRIINKLEEFHGKYKKQYLAQYADKLEKLI